MRTLAVVLFSSAFLLCGGCTNTSDIGVSQYNICCGSGCCCASLGSGGPIRTGDLNPANSCEVCDPSMSQTAWSAVADCDAGAGAVDAGPVGTDSGPVGTDAGPVGTDSGPSGTDSGPSGTDSGPSGTDAGTGGDDGGCSASPTASGGVGGLGLFVVFGFGVLMRRRRRRET